MVRKYCVRYYWLLPTNGSSFVYVFPYRTMHKSVLFRQLVGD